MVNLCGQCFVGTTGVRVTVGDCALIFGMVVDIVADSACECPCHEGHACVMPRHLNGREMEHLPTPSRETSGIGRSEPQEVARTLEGS